jgi:hypothetical protein
LEATSRLIIQILKIKKEEWAKWKSFSPASAFIRILINYSPFNLPLQKDNNIILNFLMDLEFFVYVGLFMDMIIG